MKKIIILTYFFPPGNFAGSYRIYSWAKYLNENGYYPIIITRNWGSHASDYKEMSIPTIPEIIHQKEREYEVYYLPYQGNLRDKIYLKFGEKKLSGLRKLLTFMELILQNFTNVIIPYRNIYEFSRNYLKKNDDIKLIISSGKPFVLFKFCYLLKKEFGINWIADYRDQWCSCQLSEYYGSFRKILHSLESYSEKKWVRTSMCITSVSNLWTSRISDFLYKSGYVIMNGFDEEDFFSSPEIKPFDEFTITYNGSLYFNQHYKIFLNVFKKIVEEYRRKIKIIIRFPGLAIHPDSAQDIRKFMSGFEENYLLTSRVSQKEVIEIQRRSHILLMMGYEKRLGTYSSKIFEYLACKRPIILCPSDHDVLEELILKTNSGYVCQHEEDAYNVLKNLVEEYIQNGSIAINIKPEEVNKYTRKKSVIKLASLLNDYLQKEKYYNHCPLCSHNNLQDAIFQHHFHIAKCKHCGFVFSKKKPTEIELNKLYSDYGQTDYFSPITEKRYHEVLDKFEKYRKNNRILDVGCGYGNFLKVAQKREWQAFGVEISTNATKECSTKNINIKQGYLNITDYPPEYFDIITSFEVFEHISNPLEEIKKLHTLLRPQGILYITTPNYNSFSRLLLGKKWNVAHYPEHLCYYTTSTIKTLFEKSGFQQKHIETTGISFTRYQESKDGLKETKIMEDSFDEKLRKIFESPLIMKNIKIFLNTILSILRKGDTIKGTFEKM